MKRLAVLLWLLVAAPAGAADYTVFSCAGVSSASWRGTADICSEAGTWRFNVPTRATISRARLWGSGTVRVDGAESACSGACVLEGPFGALDFEGGPLERSEVDFQDPSPPVVVSTRVTSDSVIAPVEDFGGGVLTRALVLDGAVVESIQGTGTCAPPFEVAQPCPLQSVAAFAIDPAPGTHTALVRVTDAAGQVTDGEAVSFVVDEAGVVGAVKLPKRVRAGVRVAGTAPAGASVVLAERSFGSGKWKEFRTLVAGADGQFSFPGRGRSRLVRASALGASDVVEIVAPLSVSLSAPKDPFKNLQELVLRGKLEGAGGTEMFVIVQAVVNGRWQDIGDTTAQADGDVVWAHKLTNSRRSANYRFRLRVPRVPGLPWDSVRSRVVTVRIRP